MNVVGAFITYVLAFLILLPVHEFGHAFAASALGFQSTIQGSRTSVPGVAPGSVEFLVVTASGGLIAGSVMVFLFAVGRPPYRYGFLAWAIEEFLYAMVDGQPWSYYPSGAALVLGLVFSLLLIRRASARAVLDATNAPDSCLPAESATNARESPVGIE